MRWLAALALLIAAPAFAQADEDVRFCPNRPDLGASGCVTKPGEVLVEYSAVDWERSDSADAREDSIVAGDLAVRIGVGPRTELQLGWVAWGEVRTRDRATGAVERMRGTGDMRLGVRQNVTGPDGKGLSFAIEPSVTLPVGDDGVGDGDWSAAVILPVTYDLSEDWNLALTPEIAAAVDADGSGRHARYGAAIGLGRALGETLTLVGEFAWTRDEDPVEPSREALAALSLAWQPRPRVQFDVLAVAGLSRDAPDVRLVTGGALLF